MRKALFLLATATLGAALVGCSATGTSTSKGATTLVTVTPEAPSTTPKASVSTSAPVGSRAKAFTSPDGYSFIPPAGWKQTSAIKFPGVSVFFTAPAVDKAAKFLANINVVVNANTKDLRSTIAETKRLFPTVLTQYRVAIDEPIAADGQQAHLLGGTYLQGTGHLENLQLVLLAKGKQYTVTFTCPAASFKRLRPEAQVSLLSLHVL